jgi:hypothetical protein
VNIRRDRQALHHGEMVIRLQRGRVRSEGELQVSRVDSAHGTTQMVIAKDYCSKIWINL